MQDYNKTLSSYWLDENDYDVLTGEKIKAGKDLSNWPLTKEPLPTLSKL